tara:strand:+ start:7215 stop:7478 length:264 start_codon:yes stop_codon:yes gene_type:complete
VAKKQLKEYIEQLNSYINDKDLSEQEQDALEGLIDNIEIRLDELEGEEHSDTLSEQVDELATAFEAEHPLLTGVLKDIMVKLSSMGV